jgi:DNA-binding transcriptional regulator YbjK
MTTVTLATWQFVRLMVRLEETKERQPERQKLYRHWQADWEQLDAELERLRVEDFEAFSDLMMEHEVSFDDVDDGQLRLVAEVVEEVAGQVAAARKSDGRARRKDLDFEARELAALAKTLRRLQKKTKGT